MPILYTEWSHFWRQMVTIDYDGFFNTFDDNLNDWAWYMGHTSMFQFWMQWRDVFWWWLVTVENYDVSTNLLQFSSLWCYMYFWCQLFQVMISFGGLLQECLPCSYCNARTSMMSFGGSHAKCFSVNLVSESSSPLQSVWWRLRRTPPKYVTRDGRLLQLPETTSTEW